MTSNFSKASVENEISDLKNLIASWPVGIRNGPLGAPYLSRLSELNKERRREDFLRLLDSAIELESSFLAGDPNAPLRLPETDACPGELSLEDRY